MLRKFLRASQIVFQIFRNYPIWKRRDEHFKMRDGDCSKTNKRAAMNFMTQHWQALCAMILAAAVGWFLARNEDFGEHRRRIGFALALTAVAFGIGFYLGAQLNLPKARWWMGCAFALPAVLPALRLMDRAVNDTLGGLLFDMIFVEGPFARAFKPAQKLPDLNLLRHWRDQGMVRQAYRSARRSLFREPRTFGHWLFAAETAALHLDRWGAAQRMVRRLCRSSAFPDYQKEFAVQQLSNWGDELGCEVNAEGLLEGALTDAKQKGPVSEARRLREAGRSESAGTLLRNAWRQDPENLELAFQLILVLAEDSRDFAAAERVLETVALNPTASTGFLDFARATLEDIRRRPSLGPRLKLGGSAGRSPRKRSATGGHSRIKLNASQSEPTAVPSLPDSAMPPSTDPQIDTLLEFNQMGSAIERLENGLKEFPEDFEGWMRLMDIQINRCDQVRIAEQIGRRISQDARFTPEQKLSAETRLRQWQSEHFKRNSRSW